MLYVALCLCVCYCAFAVRRDVTTRRRLAELEDWAKGHCDRVQYLACDVASSGGTLGRCFDATIAHSTRLTAVEAEIKANHAMTARVADALHRSIAVTRMELGLDHPHEGAADVGPVDFGARRKGPAA